MIIYIVGIAGFVVLFSFWHYKTHATNSNIQDYDAKKFQIIYLVVYLLATLSDWLQAPHVYALYESYNMSKHDIEIIFITGFASSMFFGTIVGSFADKYGRKFNCIMYGVFYGLACITKHFNDLYILMIGRVLTGVSTSILYSAFESWLVYEHKHRDFEESTLSLMFANACFGNSIIAILAGVIAQYAANNFGYVAPFDLSLCFLMIMILMIVLFWSENYGDSKADVKQSFVIAWKSIINDRKILYLGLVQSLFEGSMYVFVLEWTPALTNAATEPVNLNDSSKPPIPHGLIFAAYMVAIMISSNIFKLLSKFYAVESFMRVILFISSLTLSIPIFFPKNQLLMFIAFVVFEGCVGIFWPSMGTMRSRYVPEKARSTIMSFFRIPLNLIVVCVLYNNISLTVIFSFCVALLQLAVFFQNMLYRKLLSDVVNKEKTILLNA